uniref:NADH-ubiquinone oxidoreductase chain 2 n=2 Tax=unclassified Phyllothelys TaxID=2628741 RepID=A0A343UMM5_9NEOP|nr:NADH dehydrogenase subunit 2 [Phyllothelys sp. 1 JZ-2017]AVE15652.1 NADH dehydrogenase subunit 2 [Phyllothelys sp. 2 JZ-2017]
MPKNPMKILFLMTLISGVLISLCTNSWMGAWMGLEINLLSFIPLLTSNLNKFSAESALKYFLIQSIASSTLLFLILLTIHYNEMEHLMKIKTWSNLITIPLLMKSASAPLHWWLPAMIEGLSWTNCFIILTIQKIAPMILISYTLINSYFIQFMIIMSAFMGAVGGFNQTSLRKILSFSSINNIGWMLVTMIINPNLWSMYFFIYAMNIVIIISMTASMNLSYINQTFNSMNNNKLIKITLFTSILSLGGLPPLMGFFPKWITIQFMTLNLMNFTSMILIMSSLITLHYYLRMMYTTLTITNSETIWMTWIYMKFNHFKITTLTLSITFIGVLACMMILPFID